MAIVGLERADQNLSCVSFTEPADFPSSSISVVEPKPKLRIWAKKYSAFIFCIKQLTVLQIKIYNIRGKIYEFS